MTRSIELFRKSILGSRQNGVRTLTEAKLWMCMHAITAKCQAVVSQKDLYVYIQDVHFNGVEASRLLLGDAEAQYFMNANAGKAYLAFCQVFYSLSGSNSAAAYESNGVLQMVDTSGYNFSRVWRSMTRQKIGDYRRTFFSVVRTYNRKLKMNGDEWFERYDGDVFPPDRDKQRDQAHLKYESLPEVTLFTVTATTGQAISSIPVPKQQSYTGRKPVISSSLANTPCADLGVAVLLEKLNSTLGTLYTLETPSLSSLLEAYSTKDYDFGTAYAHLRPVWYDGLTGIKDKLRTCEARDRVMRQDVLVNNKIVTNTVPPRCTWDLYSNRVVPWWITLRQWPWAISHAWMEEKDRMNVLTPINGYEWPVPIPKDANLDRIRIEMLNSGAEYVWLDVLCLRQKDGRREDLRAEEWKVDVPTIGAVYKMAKKVVCYISGLGRPLSLRPGDFESDRCWFRRAWTLQEISMDPIIGGDTGNDRTMDEVMQARLETDMASLQMQKRVSTNPVDKVAGLAYLLRSDVIPAYYEAYSEEDAWTALVDVMLDEFRADLLFRYPKPGNGNKRWRPSWRQVMTEVLPSYRQFMGCAEVYPPIDGTDWYGGHSIESGYVRGLAEGPQEGKHRQGELLVEDKTEATHIFNITADHEYPIPDGSYTLIGSDPFLFANPKVPILRSQYWVVGQRLSDWKFEKVSVFKMLDTEVVRLMYLGVATEIVNILV
ncbi:hypothetical protein ARMSODRAFT_1010000 [Armillaria solidipes]|uniref:Uncharacterized protein n=1 Tax=Armillaria solidipes TaxID=1076256 RepID=A0A2H3B4R2_9AGAR|nr:hypothetical protein ARMSODRAFT_1010000 [Armillaria solidipes]